MKPFEINCLDHVAIRVKDMDASVKWYQDILGLKPYKLEKWGDFPVFMLAGKTGVAIFPAQIKDDAMPGISKNVKIDHYAFNVSNVDFLKAQDHFNNLKIPFEFQDHHYFHSIYLRDPDDHQVELTTLMMDENSFY